MLICVCTCVCVCMCVCVCVCVQRLCEELEYSELLDEAAALSDPCARMVRVVVCRHDYSCQYTHTPLLSLKRLIYLLTLCQSQLIYHQKVSCMLKQAYKRCSPID